VNLYWTLAVATLTLHLVWILWVLLGWLVTRNRPLLRWLHIASLAYAIGIEVLLWPCPLTYAENFFLRRAGRQPYAESFLIHYLEAVIYPDIPQWLITAVGVTLCTAIFGVHLLRFRRRHPTGW
jgi:hypothetical protein